MLKLNGNIKLNGKEKDDLRAISGRPEVPGTVGQYNRQLDNAAAEWAETECAEGELLAWMALDMKVAE